MLVELLIFVGTFVSIYYFYTKHRFRNFPPGPWGIPLMGYLPYLGCTPHRKYSELAKKYGKIFSLTFGNLPVVVLNDYEIIKKALRQDVFSGRPNKTVLAMKVVCEGMSFNEGQPWYEQRRFTLKVLKDLGFGKSSLETSVKDELHRLLTYLKTKTDKPFDFKQTFEISVMNTLWLITAGEAHDYENPVALRWHKLAYEGFIEPEVAGPVWFMPWLAKIAPEKTGYNKLLIAVEAMRNEFRMFLERRKKSYNREELIDFVDYYFKEIDDTKDQNSSFYKETGMKNLVDLLINLFSAGSDTTSATLCWGFLYLLKNPKIYQKLKDELEKVVGHGNLPTLNDKPSLPYTEAFIHELLRITSITSGALLHSTTENITFEGYNFPRGTIILPNLFHCQHNPDYWVDPEELRPERWLTTSNDGHLEFKKDEHSIPFSIGKRICPAEHLALMNLFLFFTGLIQTFDFSVAEETDPLPTLDPKPGLVLHPQSYKVVMKLRN